MNRDADCDAPLRDALLTEAEHRIDAFSYVGIYASDCENPPGRLEQRISLQITPIDMY